MIRGFARRLLALPAPRHRVDVQREWIALSDGVRLATTIVRPRDPHRPRAAAVLVRTPFGLRHPLEPTAALAAALAGAGLYAVVQDVRGRFDSEGRFEPFVHEAADGDETLRWVAEQPWCDGRVALLGSSYEAWAALAAASRTSLRPAALVLAAGGSDLRRVLRPGGALALELSLSMALGLSGRTPEPAELGRALGHRPLREADRVGLRETPWFREWLAHPIADAYWAQRRPSLAELPPTLLVGGLYDPFLPAQLADHEGWRADRADAARLVLGPWTHPRPLRPLARGARAQQRVMLREMLVFLRAWLDGGSPTGPPVRTYGPDASFLDLDGWPPREAQRRVLYLRSGGSAASASGDGRLADESPAPGEAADRFVYDPSDPVPSLGGALLIGGGPADQRGAEERQDVLCYTSEPLGRRLRAIGPARVVLHAASSAPDTDFTAKLVDVDPDGGATLLAEGIVRCRHRGGGEPLWLDPDEPVRLELELGALCHTWAVGHRVRLEVSSSSFPRFDRNPNTRTDPALATAQDSQVARQTLLHEASLPSFLELFACDG